MKIAIVGSREFSDVNFCRMQVENYFYKLYTLQNPEYVSGGAKGPDTWGEQVINYYNSTKGEDTKKHIFIPDWDKHGKSAGFIRNKLIIDTADLVVAFWDGVSKGTKHSIDLAIKAGKPVDVYIRRSSGT